MEKEFIPYEQALALKALGFDEECLLTIQHSGDFDFITREPYRSNAWLNGDRINFEYDFPKYGEKWEKIKIPTFSQAFRWFREKHKLDLYINRMPPEMYGKGKNGTIKKYLGYIWAENLNPRGQDVFHFDTYEEAELEGLKKLIEICQQTT